MDDSPNAAAGAHRRSSTGHSTLWDRILGVDVFISYSRTDASDYALTLRDALEGRGYRCLFDTRHFCPGDELDGVTRRWVKKSRMMVVVVTRESLGSKFVCREVELFLSSRPRHPLVAIDTGVLKAALADDPGVIGGKDCLPRLVGSARIWEDEKGWPTPSPSPLVVDRVAQAFTSRRQDHRAVRLLSIIVAVGAFATSVIISLLMFAISLKNETIHQSQLREMASHQREIALLTNAEDWADAHLLKLDRLVSKLRDLDTAAAAEADASITKRFAEVIGGEVRRAQPLGPDEAERIGHRLDRLAARDADRARELRGALDQRLGRPQRIFTVAGSTPGWEAVFDLARVRAVDGRLRPRLPAEVTPEGIVPTRVMSPGNASIEATFSADWETAHSIGLALHANQGHNKPIRALAVSPDGTRLASSGEDLAVKVWDVDSGRVLRSFEDFTKPVDVLTFSPDGRTLAASTPGVGLRLWDVAGLIERPALPVPGPGSSIRAAAFAPDGRTVATVCSDGSVSVWDAVTGAQLITLHHPPDVASCLAFSPDGTVLAVGSRAGSITLWNNARTWRKGRVLAGPAVGVECLSFSPDGGVLATGHLGAPMKIWDIASGEAKASVEDETRTRSVTYMPDGKRLITANADGFRVRDTEGWLPREPESAHLSGLGAAAFSPHLASLFIGANDGSIHRWRMDNFREYYPLQSKSYLFRLTVPVPATLDGKMSPAPPPLTSVRKTRGSFQLEILRNGFPLRNELLSVDDVPPGPLRLRAARAGGRLTFQIGARRPLEFYDVFPLGGDDPGVFAVQWPESVGLERLVADAPALPAKPSPLELGDEHYARLRFDEAVAAYESQATASGATGLGRHARYKKALALIALNHDDEAASELEQVIREARLKEEKGEPWPPLALCQLWLMRLRQEKPEEAEDLFEELLKVYPFFELDLAKIVPVDLRFRILDAYCTQGRSYNLYMPDPARIVNLERAVRVGTYFQGPRHIDSRIKVILLRAYRVAGREDEALRLSREILPDPDEVLQADWYLPQVVEHCWLLRSEQGPVAALAELDRWLFERPGVYREGMTPLLLERSRLVASLGWWDQAERDIDELFRRLPPQSLIDDLPAACLVRGFLRERSRDKTGAMAAWRQGLRKPTDVDPLRGFEWVQSLILGALTGDLSDDKAEALKSSLLGTAGENPLASVARLVNPPASLLREAWLSSQGREDARRFAFREGRFDEIIRIPPLAFGTEYLRRTLFPQGATPEEGILLRKAVERSYEAYVRGRINTEQLMYVGGAWTAKVARFRPSPLKFWGAVAPSLDPELRGWVGYLLGLRHLRKGNQPEARTFFRAARDAATRDSLLYRYAGKALDHLSIPAAARP